MSTKSTSMVRFRSSAHLVMVSGKAPSSCPRQSVVSDQPTGVSTQPMDIRPGRHCFPASLRANTDLDSKDVLTGVALEQGPLRHLSLQEVRAHGHLTAGHIRTKALADAAKG